MEAPVAPLFFGLNQTERVQIKKIVLDESHLLFGQATALQVDRDASEMRRRSVPVYRRRVAIVAAQFLLYRDGTHGGV